VVIDIVIPARNEAATVAGNVDAARDCLYGREVIVVDDGSTDDTADRARAAGAKVLARPDSPGSKAHALAAGVAASDADAFLFVDADCVGLTARHLDRICEAYLDGGVAMSVGTFDRGPLLNAWVTRFPVLSGERLVPRWLFESVTRLDGYTIEVRLDEVIAEGRLPTVVQTMDGVTHRTKRHKLGPARGLAATLGMARDLLAPLVTRDIRLRTFAYYLRGLRVISSRRA
jgi:glycosyltransferase involved in cell wall biosynthesis